MLDDPRIKRVLKRYPKDDHFSDASIDVSTYGDLALLEACGRECVDEMSGPIELDHRALDHFATRLGIEFDRSQFDYFLHSYVRSEFLESYYDDPTVTSFPVSEDGPPAKIPTPEGAQWCAVRPKNGKEHFELFRI
jgi:hypothetical protein